MSANSASHGVVRFGVFELDLRSGELRKRGVHLRLEPKPLQILEMLLGRAGEIVTRKEIQQKLWPDTFVDFEYSLNTAVNKLRLALGDIAGSPRFIETVARRGYRFLPLVVAAGPAVPGQAPVSSVAVLPFRNVSGQGELDFLSDGLGEAVIRRVSQAPGVRVMAWSTVLRYKGREMDPQATGRELRVQSVLVGRATFAGTQVHANVELVDVETGWRLWGEEYRRSSDEIQSLAEEMAKEIAARVGTGGAPERESRQKKTASRPPEAYRDYLKGRYHWYKLSREDLQKSLAYFELAIEKDPSFALAHAALADAYVLLAFVGLLHPREAMEKARKAALQALALDGELAEAHASCASVSKLYDRDWVKAEREYRKALQLDPHNAITRRGYADFLSALGRTEEALAEIHKAQELDQTSLVIGIEVAWNLYMAREYEKARQQAMQILEMEPGFPAARNVLGMALEGMRRYEEAIECLRHEGERAEAHQAPMASLAHALAMSGQSDAARAILDQLAAEFRERYVAPYLFAVIHTGLGERGQAIARLEEGFEARDVWMIWANRDPRLDSLRAEPRFRRLIQMMKFPDGSETEARPRVKSRRARKGRGA